MKRKGRTTLASLSHSFLTSLYECGSRVGRQTFPATQQFGHELITFGFVKEECLCLWLPLWSSPDRRPSSFVHVVPLIQTDKHTCVL